MEPQQFSDLVRVAKSLIYSMDGNSELAEKEMSLVREPDLLPDFDDVDVDTIREIYGQAWEAVQNEKQTTVEWKRIERNVA